MENRIEHLLTELNNEPNEILQLFKSIDIYEYIFKSIAATRIVDAITNEGVDRTGRQYRLLSAVLRERFQRPSFGDWIAAYRHADASISGDRRNSRSIGKDADEVVTVRNRLAHGITPKKQEAIALCESIKPILDRIADYYVTNGIEERFAVVVEHSPFGNGTEELYNGVRNRKRIEYLNYVLGTIVSVEGLLGFREFFRTYLRGDLAVSDDEVLSLLRDYFPRDYWEDRVTRSFREFSGTLLVGDTGVGKTTLVARTAQRLNCGLFRFREADRAPDLVIRGFRTLFTCLRREIGNVPYLPEDVGGDELIPALSHLAERSRHEGWIHHFVFDAINELDESELGLFGALLEQVRGSGIHLLVSSRRRGHIKLLGRALGDVERIELEPLTELELKEWIVFRSSEVRFPSLELLYALSTFSAGSFLLLQSLPEDLSEDRYLELMRTTPSSVESVFRDTTVHLGDMVRFPLFISIVPGPVSRELIAVRFGLTVEQVVYQLDNAEPAVRERRPGEYELFHPQYRAYLIDAFPDERDRMFRETVALIDHLCSLFFRLSDIPVLFSRFKAFRELETWLSGVVLSPPRLRETDRYAYANGVVHGFTVLFGNGRRPTGLLDTFIDANFQLLVDWNLAPEIIRSVNHSACHAAHRYRHLELLRGCVAYTENDTEMALTTLNGIDPTDLNARDRRRRLDYIGLSYRKTGDRERAIATFSRIIEEGGGDRGDAWIGYAVTNRGKILLSLGRYTEAERDLLLSVDIRARIAFDRTVFNANRDDIGSDVQAVLTLAMGYENLMWLYAAMGKIASGVDASRRAEEIVIRSLQASPEQTRDFRFSGRIMISVTEFRLEHAPDAIPGDTLHVLSQLFVRGSDIRRYQTVVDGLQHGTGRTVDDILEELRALEGDYAVAEMNDDESRIRILESRLERTALAISNDPGSMERIAARTGMTQSRITRKLTLEGLGTLLAAIDG